jgi:hypothetical protein
MDGAAGIRVVLATDGGGGEHELAAVCAWRSMDLHGLRVVLEFFLQLGLGALSLWALASERDWLGLVSGHPLGSGVGVLAAL